MAIIESPTRWVQIFDAGDSWQLSPIRIIGGLTIELLGIKLGRIDLDLTISSRDDVPPSSLEASSTDDRLAEMTRREL